MSCVQENVDGSSTKLQWGIFPSVYKVYIVYIYSHASACICTLRVATMFMHLGVDKNIPIILLNPFSM